MRLNEELNSDILNIDTLTEMYGDNSPDTIIWALTSFRSAALPYITSISHSVACEDISGVSEAAHALKGIAGLTGAHQMARLSQELELIAHTEDKKMTLAGIAGLLQAWQLFLSECQLHIDYYTEKHA